MSTDDVHERLRRAADVLDELQPEERDELLDRQIFAFRKLGDFLEEYGQWGVPPLWDGYVLAADIILAGQSVKGGQP
jgi:hypothetical protein